jgi:O-antigen ligase
MFFGVGTNEYERIIQQRYAYLPEFLRAGIHGEFLRILTENGLIGLLSYLTVWLVAWHRTHAVLRAQVDADRLTTSQAALLQIVAFVPCLLYVSFEASGTHSIVVLTFISLLPEGLTAWRARASEYAVTPDTRSALRRPMRQPVVAARPGILGGSS